MPAAAAVVRSSERRESTAVSFSGWPDITPSFGDAANRRAAVAIETPADLTSERHDSLRAGLFRRDGGPARAISPAIVAE